MDVEEESKALVNDATMVPGTWALAVEFGLAGCAICIPAVALQMLKVQLFEPEATIEKTTPAGTHEVPAGVVAPQSVGLAAITMEYSC